MHTVDKTRRRILITGTDTGIGKSVVSLLCMKYFLKKGDVPFYVKPFQTGCAGFADADNDPRFVYTRLPEWGYPPDDSMICCFRNPKAPRFAARDEGRTIDIADAAAKVEDLARRYSPLIIEGAGGIYVPINEKETFVDFIPRIDARPLIVARAGLGTINHTVLTVASLRHAGIEPLGIIFNQGQEVVPDSFVDENADAIADLTGIRPAGTIPQIEDFSEIPDRVFSVFGRIFEGM